MTVPPRIVFDAVSAEFIRNRRNFGENVRSAKLRIGAIKNLSQTSALLTSDFRLLDSIWEENRICISLGKVAPSVIAALIATEDRRFYSHNGVDARGILRAAYANLRAGHLVQGGSTVTQQLARIAVLRRTDRTLARKLLELCVAVLLEGHFAKEQILEAYLNAAYFGHNINGIELAALTFCNKRAADLDEIEAAYLVGLLKAPSRYCCCCNPDRASARTRLVYRLARFQTITSNKFATAGILKERPHFADLFPATAGYPKEYVRLWLKQKLPESYPSKRLKVHTTIDPQCQSALEVACGEIRSKGYSGRLACLVQDSHGGAIRAIAGGTDFRSHQFNSAADGCLQPGSLLKPFILLAAIKKGISVDQTLESRPLRIRLDGGGIWDVRNAGNKYRGPITIAQALVHSDNSVFAQLLLNIGVEPACQVLDAAGLPMKHATPAISTGAIRPGVSPLQICSAYSVFSSHGTFIPSSIISRVVDESGKCLWNSGATAVRICTQSEVTIVINILKRVCEEGTGILPVTQAGLAAKTGTSISGGWYMSFNDAYRVLTWTENDFLPVGVSQFPEKAVSAKVLANRIWQLLTKPKLGFSELYSVFAGVDTMSVRDLLWVEDRFQSE
jgi:penicillin-binding protein 1A